MTDLMRELEADFQPTNEELLQMTLEATAEALDAARDRNAELVEENERLAAALESLELIGRVLEGKKSISPANAMLLHKALVQARKTLKAARAA